MEKDERPLGGVYYCTTSVFNNKELFESNLSKLDYIPICVGTYTESRVPLESGHDNDYKVREFIKRVTNGNTSPYYSFGNLCEVANRAEYKMASLNISPTYRGKAICAYRPEGIWVKNRVFEKAPPTIQLVRGESRWYLDTTYFYEGPRVRGEELILTKQQSQLVYQEVKKRFRISEK